MFHYYYNYYTCTLAGVHEKCVLQRYHPQQVNGHGGGGGEGETQHFQGPNTILPQIHSFSRSEVVILTYGRFDYGRILMILGQPVIYLYRGHNPHFI